MGELGHIGAQFFHIGNVVVVQERLSDQRWRHDHTAARIFAIADVFDALSSERPYKEALPLDKVVEILEEGRGRHFDPDLLTSFLEIAPDLRAELITFDDNDLRDEMHRINRRYFASGLETLLA
jgi:hypothetical protein